MLLILFPTRACSKPTIEGQMSCLKEHDQSMARKSPIRLAHQRRFNDLMEFLSETMLSLATGAQGTKQLSPFPA